MSIETIEYATATDWRTMNRDWIGSSTDDEETNRELVLIKTVVNNVIKRVFELDNNEPDRVLAPSRVPPEIFTVGETYPSHAAIVVSDIDTANDVVDYMNKKFQEDRDRFPVNKGWKAITAHSRHQTAFNKDHPFFYYLNNGRLNSRSTRFLVVVNMAKEGMNNKYLNVMGIAKNVGNTAVLEIVQRIGRLIRSAHKKVGDNLFEVPPIEHDRIHIITHQEYNNDNVINQALSFMRNMADSTSNILSIAEYANPLDFGELDEDDIGYKPTLTYKDYMVISDMVGLALSARKGPPIRAVLKKIGSKKKGKQELIKNFVKDLHNRNDEAVDLVRKSLFKTNCPPALADVAIDDVVTIPDLSVDDAFRYLKDSKLPSMVYLGKLLAKVGEEGGPVWLDAVNEFRRELDISMYRSTMFNTRQDLPSVLVEMAHSFADQFQLHSDKRAVVMRYVEEAAMTRLSNFGATSEDLTEHGSMNRPAVVQAFRNKEWQRAVKQWVGWSMYEGGYLPHIHEVLKPV